MSAFALAGLTLRARRRRVLALVAFAIVFLAAALTARLLGRGQDGHVEMDELFRVGGYQLVSALLLLGWTLGRFPMIATLVLMAGVVSDDRTAGYARLYAVRPVSLLRIYGVRFLVLALAAFLISAVLLPVFDILVIGDWAGPAVFVLIAAHLLVYGGLTALLSVFTRGDAWIVLLLGIASIVWHALRSTGRITIAPGPRGVITFLLPPQDALFRLEGAFGQLQPIPWDAFAYAAGYGVSALVLAGLALARREL